MQRLLQRQLCSSTTARTFLAKNLGDPLRRAFEGYARAADGRPVLVGAATAGTMWFIGDVVAQKAIEQRPAIDAGRLGGTVVHGAAVTGAAGAAWYMFLDRFVKRSAVLGATSRRAVGAKLFLELALWEPFTLCCFWTLVCLGQGKSLDKAKIELREGFSGGMVAELAIWAPVSLANFALVPVKLQVLVVSIASLIEAVTLSWLHSATEQQHHASPHVGGAQEDAFYKHHPVAFEVSVKARGALQNSSSQSEHAAENEFGASELEWLDTGL